MQETLKRELNQIFLILEDDENDYEETFELEMILRNNPESILPLRVLRVDGKLQLCYEITSKQTLKVYGETRKLTKTVIQRLFRRIQLLAKEIKDYMLDMDNVLLDPEHIYMKEEEFYFCYCPWQKEDSFDALRGMAEEILGLLDYHDAKGVEMAYHIYQNLCKGIFEIDEILEDEEEESLPEEPVEMLEAMCFEEEPESESAKVMREPKSGIFQRFLSFFLKKEPDVHEDEEEMFSEEEFRDDFYERTILSGEMQEDSPTLLLDPIAYGVWRLRPLTEGMPEFVIGKEGFLVGKKKELVDGYIGKDTISRVHSRFDLRDGCLFVTDANSTNGTFVNGTAVEPGEEREIFSGDRILFADVGYECYNSL